MATDAQDGRNIVQVEIPAHGPDASEIAIAVTGMALVAFGLSAGIAFVLARRAALSARARVQLVSALAAPLLALAFLVFGPMAVEGLSFGEALHRLGRTQLRGWLIIGVLFLSGWLGARVVYRMLIGRGFFELRNARVFD